MEVAPEGTSLEMSDADGFTTSIGNGMQASKGKQPKKTTAASVTSTAKTGRCSGQLLSHTAHDNSFPSYVRSTLEP